MNTFSKRTEIDLNECQHFLKANRDRPEIDPSLIHLSMNGSLETTTIIYILKHKTDHITRM